VVTFERAPVQIPPADCKGLVGLQQRRVPDHVREHHRNKATVENHGHEAILSARARPRQHG
jgi:hypothetical protein